jgi:hypothetical protein
MLLNPTHVRLKRSRVWSIAFLSLKCQLLELLLTVATINCVETRKAADENWCSLVEHKITGFVRTEVLFEVLSEIFANQSMQVITDCKITSLEAAPSGETIKVNTHKDCQMEVPGGQNVLFGNRQFDRVVVSANAASVSLLNEADPLLDRHLVGIKGYGMVGAVNVRCAFSGRNLQSRMSLEPTHVRFKRTCV